MIGNKLLIFYILLLFFKLFIYLLAVLGLCCYVDFSLVVLSAGSSLVAVHGFLIELVSLVVAHGLSSCVVHGLSCSVECGIFLDQGSNPRLLH